MGLILIELSKLEQKYFQGELPLNVFKNLNLKLINQKILELLDHQVLVKLLF